MFFNTQKHQHRFVCSSSLLPTGGRKPRERWPRLPQLFSPLSSTLLICREGLYSPPSCAVVLYPLDRVNNPLLRVTRRCITVTNTEEIGVLSLPLLSTLSLYPHLLPLLSSTLLISRGGLYSSPSCAVVLYPLDRVNNPLLRVTRRCITVTNTEEIGVLSLPLLSTLSLYPHLLPLLSSTLLISRGGLYSSP